MVKHNTAKKSGREFIAIHPVTGKYILIRQGYPGFIEYPCSAGRAVTLNEVNGNSDEDVFAAVGSAVTGWNRRTWSTKAPVKAF